MDINFKKISNNISRLTVYKNIAADDTVKVLSNLCENESSEELFTKLILLLVASAEKNGYTGNIFKKHIYGLILKDENIFSLYCENKVNIEGTSLFQMTLNDLRALMALAETDLSLFSVENENLKLILNYTPVNKAESLKLSKILEADNPNSLLKALSDFYTNNGCGDISVYKTFKYSSEKGIVGIPNPDEVTFDDIVGYENQVNELMKNTEAFINGYQANNVLLVGSRGTGKSTSVKALANKYFNDGLRLLEITKDQILQLPDILEILKRRGKRFIIYIDDLSFDESEIQYKHMKSLLDGGSQSKPENVLFYATSNRRNLIQEKWSDRQRGSDEAEIHTSDTLNEKLSLADRFGITITYPKPSPNEYLNMVKVMAQKLNLDIDNEILKKEAMKWEINQKGLSGRTAKQFINNLVWEINSKK